MRPPCKSAAEALADSPIAGLLDQARRLDRISSIVDAVSRELTRNTEPMPAPRCTLQGSTVVIGVRAPSQAAKLRQCATQISRALRERLPEVTGIRIQLQPGRANYPMPGIEPAQENPLPAERPGNAPNLLAAMQFADDLATQLHDSPLRESALRLQAALRRRVAKGD